MLVLTAYDHDVKERIPLYCGDDKEALMSMWATWDKAMDGSDNVQLGGKILSNPKVEKGVGLYMTRPYGLMMEPTSGGPILEMFFDHKSKPEILALLRNIIEQAKEWEKRVEQR